MSGSESRYRSTDRHTSVAQDYGATSAGSNSHGHVSEVVEHGRLQNSAVVSEEVTPGKGGSLAESTPSHRSTGSARISANVVVSLSV